MNKDKKKVGTDFSKLVVVKKITLPSLVKKQVVKENKPIDVK